MKIMIRCKIVLACLMFLAVQASVKAGSITNNFDNSFDYIANGVPGTMWDGVYLDFGDVPGGNPRPAILVTPSRPMKPPIRVS